MPSKMKWWGYLHVNRSIQVKRYFGPRDISEAWESPFVERAYGPFMAEGRQDALNQMEELFHGKA